MGGVLLLGKVYSVFYALTIKTYGLYKSIFIDFVPPI